MSRKKYCVLKPENLPFFEQAANECGLPFHPEHDVNAQGTPLVRIWIDFNHDTFASEFVKPRYDKLRNAFNKVFNEEMPHAV